MKVIFSFLLCCFAIIFSVAQNIIGVVSTEQNVKVGGVVIINIRTNEKVYTNEQGVFEIDAEVSDEIRLVKKGYDRASYIVKFEDFKREIQLNLQPAEIMIEELVISKIKLTGNLAKDSKSLDKIDQNLKIQKSLGISDIEKKVKTITHSGISFSPDNLFGKNRRRKKNLENYERLESNTDWIKSRIEEEFFTDKKLPRDSIVEFIGFAISEKPEIISYIKTNNVLQIKIFLEKVLPIYLKRLDKN